MQLARTLACLLAASAPALAQEVRVREEASGCYGGSERVTTWVLDQGLLRSGALERPVLQLDRLRALALAAPGTVPDLLATVGVDRATLAAHRDDVLRAALPRSRTEGGQLPELPAHLEPLLGWEALHERLERELLSANYFSTQGYELEVVLPGEPPITLTSNGLRPWMLPWTVSVGERSWVSPDVRISRALLPWVPPEGPCGHLLDGGSYWSEALWSDSFVWRRFVGGALDAAFSANAYAQLEGWELANGLLRVERAMTGNVNLQPHSLQIDLTARHPSLIDELRWWNPTRDGAPGHSWHDLLRAWQAGSEAVERESWITDWKLAGPARTVGLEVVGGRGISQTMLESMVLPAWHHAGFPGEPDFQLLLRRDRDWCATIYLARGHAGGLIETAHAGEGAHWLDRLEFSFHPRAKPPTYARVDAAGAWQQRSMP